MDTHSPSTPSLDRRGFLKTAALGAATLPGITFAQTGPSPAPLAPAGGRKARINLSINLEMSRNFPTWDQTHWDFQKGNLDEANKRYAVEAARFVKERGGLIDFFVIGETLEHESVAWLEEIHSEGHPIGNHTYYHVNMRADRAEDLQHRYRRSPWLVEGRRAIDVVEEDARMTNAALRHRLGITQVRGYRSSNEYPTGLDTFPEEQEMLKRVGFDWASTRFARVRVPAGQRASEDIFDEIAAAQAQTQPYIYPSGLVELPKSPISDVGAFRGARWGIGDYLEMVRRGAEWCIENGACYFFSVHSSVLVERDPDFRVWELLCDLAKQESSRAELVTLNQIADQTRQSGRRS